MIFDFEGVITPAAGLLMRNPARAAQSDMEVLVEPEKNRRAVYRDGLLR